MIQEMFSWQKNDWETLSSLKDNRISLVYGKDFDSAYNIFHLFCHQHSEDKIKLFHIRKSDPRITVPLFPFSSAAQESPSNFSMDKNVIGGIIKDVTRSETVVSLVLSFLKRKPKMNIMVDDKSNELLGRFQRLAGGRSTVFVFQNYSFYDDSSKELIDLILSESLNDAYPFLLSAKFYFLCSDSESPLPYQKIENHEHRNINLSNPSASDMREIVKEMSPCSELTPEESDKLFMVCGGSLVALQILLQYSHRSQVGNYTLEYADGLIQSIIAKRMCGFSTNYSDLEKTLKVAAAVGDPFSLQLIQWIMGLPDDVFGRIMSKSQEELFVECNSKDGNFTYPILREYFCQAGNSQEKVKIFKSIADGIHYFNPRDYWERATFLELSGDEHVACEVYFLAFHSLFFETHKYPVDCVKKIASLSRKCGYEDFWGAQIKFYNYYKDLKYEQALVCFDACTTQLSPRLHLLKEYLTALCAYKIGGSRQQKESALVSLRVAAEKAKSIEKGLWCDCLSTLISFCANIDGYMQEALNSFKELEYYYTNHQDKKYAQIGMNILNRKSASLFSVERAVMRTQKSVAYFENNVYSTQYLMALNNHGGNLMLLGKFDEAESYLAKALEFTQSLLASDQIVIYLINNLCVCRIQKGCLNHPVFSCLCELLEKYMHYDWSIIPFINYAIFVALNGEIERGINLLTKAQEISSGLGDSYCDYYINANLASMLYLKGDRRGASKMLVDKCSIPPALSKTTEQQYLKQRTQRWSAAMNEHEITDPWDFFNLLSDENGGNQWGFVSRGFLCSDLQFWSEA